MTNILTYYLPTAISSYVRCRHRAHSCESGWSGRASPLVASLTVVADGSVGVQRLPLATSDVIL